MTAEAPDPHPPPPLADNEPRPARKPYIVRPTGLELVRFFPGTMALFFALAVAGSFGLHLLVPSLALPIVVGYLVLCAVVGSSLLGRLLPVRRVGAIVGADGLLVRGRFLPYSEIRDVHFSWYRGKSKSPKQPTPIQSNVSVERMDGERIHLTANVLPELRDAIDKARAAWAAGPGDQALAEGLLTSAKGSGLEWLHALRALGSGKTDVYRKPELDSAQVARLLDDAQARPSSRAAAAVMLAASGDTSAAKKLRIAAESVANPRVRVAFDRIAASKDDAAVAEALDALDAEEREQAGRAAAG